MLPPLIPLFPLPNVVLFPNVSLPLHIFEPRYRALVTDVLAGDRIIGMVLLQAGSGADDHGRPPIYPIGTAGVITHAEPLPDGRFDIVLRGIEKFRVTGEEGSKAYRLASVEPIGETLSPTDRDALRRQRRALEAMLPTVVDRAGADPQFPPSIPDEDLVNALAQYLAFEPIERQALLEQEGVLARAHTLMELLEMKSLPRPGGTVH